MRDFFTGKPIALTYRPIKPEVYRDKDGLGATTAVQVVKAEAPIVEFRGESYVFAHTLLKGLFGTGEKYRVKNNTPGKAMMMRIDRDPSIRTIIVDVDGKKTQAVRCDDMVALAKDYGVNLTL